MPIKKDPVDASSVAVSNIISETQNNINFQLDLEYKSDTGLEGLDFYASYDKSTGLTNIPELFTNK